MRLANIWSDGIVVQQQKKIRIWGKSNPGDKIRIKWIRTRDNEVIREVDAISDENGLFLAELNPIAASFETYKLSCVCNDELIEVDDILIGEVWLTCGQSNMFLPIIQTLDMDDLLNRANNEKIRFVTTNGSDDRIDGYPVLPFNPQFDIHYDKWHKTDNSKEIEWLSCIGFSFALMLFGKLNVPIGLINTSVGGSKIDAWLSREVVENNKSIKNYLKSVSRYIEEEFYNKQGETNFTQNSGLFNERIAPVTNLNIRGTLWIQGESNAGKGEKEAAYYKHAFYSMINDWNKRFRDKNQPFIFTHITYQNYQFDPSWVAYLNEAFDDVWKKTSKFTIQVPIYDMPLDWKIPNELYCHPIHPVVKAKVGERMANMALSKIYFKNNEYEIPFLKHYKICGDRIILKFDGVGETLRVNGGEILRGFTICEEDGIHIEADAIISKEDEITLSNENITEPKGATYAFSSANMNSNLSNSSGLPAVPFRTGRKNETYYTMNPWMSCDYKNVWVNCFEWALGVTEFKPTWKVATLTGTLDAKLSFDSKIKSEGSSSLKIDYKPDLDRGNIIGVSPIIDYVGYYHHMERFDHITFDLHNPDNREKIFIGILIKTCKGKVYVLPIEDNGEYKPYITIAANSGFKKYKVSLKNFCGCYMVREKKIPADMSDVTDMQFSFIDSFEGSLFIDNIRFGWDTNKQL